MSHFNQTQKRKAQFIKPINTLKAKVGSGGLTDEILDRAQTLLEENTVDFAPLADMYLDSLMVGINFAKEKTKDPAQDKEEIINLIISPVMQLKANGGMFKYNLVTSIANKLIQFLEVIDEPDMQVIEIIVAFHTTIRAVVMGRVMGDGGQHGRELMRALEDACQRYFDKHPDNRDPEYLG